MEENTNTTDTARAGNLEGGAATASNRLSVNRGAGVGQGQEGNAKAAQYYDRREALSSRRRSKQMEALSANMLEVRNVMNNHRFVSGGEGVEVTEGCNICRRGFDWSAVDAVRCVECDAVFHVSCVETCKSLVCILSFSFKFFVRLIYLFLFE